MSSQFKVHDETWGTLKIFAIYIQEDGSWEDDWEPLREEEQVADLLSTISWDAYQELRHRYTRPFLQERGLGPDACLIKLDDETGSCYYQDECASHDASVCGASLDPPPCYDANVEPLPTRSCLTRLVDLWRLDFHVILVQPENT